MYATNLSNIYMITFLAILLWTALQSKLEKRNHLLWKALNCIGVLISIYIILSYTVLNRTPSDNHTFVLYADYTNEFYREMVMNAFLYFPFGLALSTSLSSIKSLKAMKVMRNNKWTCLGIVFIGFVVSMSIESWQYITGSGLAQGTDVLMNTLGTVIGCVPVLVVRFGVTEKVIHRGKELIGILKDGK